MSEQSFVDQAHDRAIQRTVDTLNKNSANLTPNSLPVVVVRPKHNYLVFGLMAYTILYTLATVIAVFVLTSRINDSYITPQECVRRQDARTALRLGINKNPGLTAEDRIFIDAHFPAEISCPP